MDKKRQRIAIAEACGLAKSAFHQDYPDYLTDLNVMHEVEKWLHGTPEEFNTSLIIHNRWRTYETFVSERFGISATAAQRAEAFLRTIGKWEEDD